MPFEVPVASLNAKSSQTVALDDVVYRFEFEFNTRCLAWHLNVQTQDGTPLVQGIKLLANIDLLGRHKDTRLPKGRLYAIDTEEGEDGIRPEKNQLGTKLRLLYFTEAEVDALIQT
jgi:hypothetical protein